MKKLLILFIILRLTNDVISQNVGVGITTPTQKLDVAGNINTSGNLMVNGVAGANGQVLTMNGSSMQWMDKSRFKNWAIYTGSSVFTVPSGITEVMVEMWGGGGGAHNPGGGGGSGGYWTGLIQVAGITSINITIGSGGTTGSGATAGSAGTNTSFTCTGFNVAVEGGGGADTTVNTIITVYSSGDGGSGLVTLVVPSGFRDYFFVNGNPGTPSFPTVVETATGVFEENTIFGVGGVAPFSGQSPYPVTYSTNLPGSVLIRSVYGSGSFTGFGCGGTPRGASGGSTAANGGSGRLIIYY